MSAFEVFAFQDSSRNTIKYLFNPNRRLSVDGEGPVILDQYIETSDVSDNYESTTSAPEPKPGTEIFHYQARDGAEVRYQFDPTAQNGKQYVIAIHRAPENWMQLREEDLAVDNEIELRRKYDKFGAANNLQWNDTDKTGSGRRDSVQDLSTDQDVPMS